MTDKHARLIELAERRSMSEVEKIAAGLDKPSNDLVEDVVSALRSRYLAIKYDQPIHWKDMALAAINAVHSHLHESTIR